MIKSRAILLIFVALYVSANAVHYFINGSNHIDPAGTKILVGLQFLIGIAAALYIWLKHLRKKEGNT